MERSLFTGSQDDHDYGGDLVHGRRRNWGTFASEYEVGKKIGEGAYGSVAKATHRLTGTTFAIKRIQKSLIKDGLENRSFEAEVKALTLLVHPHVVHLVEYFESDEEYALVLEFCSGPDLFDYLVERVEQGGEFSEAEIAVLLRHMLKGLLACHIHGIIHNDIKPENYMFRKGPGSSLKMIDLGLSGFFRESTRAGENIGKVGFGTLEYTAPEVVDGAFGLEGDVWAVGVIFFMLLFGAPLFPLTGTLPRDAKVRMIKDPRYLRNALTKEPRWCRLRPQAQDLVQRMLERDPRKRITVSEALKHDFIQDSYMYCPYCGQYRVAKPDAKIVGQRHQVLMDVQADVLELVIRRMQHFANAPALLRLSLTIIAHEFTGSSHANFSEAGLYRRAFRAMNEKHDGYLTKQDMLAAFGAHGICVEGDFGNAFEVMATSDPGCCTIFEFLAAVTDPHVPCPPKIIEATWSELDRSRRGYITAEDIEALMPNAAMTKADHAAIIAEVADSRDRRKVTYAAFERMLLSYGRE